MKYNIGTICKIKNSDIKVVIIGYNGNPVPGNHLYDYVGCLYPEGYTSAERLCFFDNNHIGNIVFNGYAEKQENENNDVVTSLYTFDENGVLISLQTNNNKVQKNNQESNQNKTLENKNEPLKSIDISSIE